MAFYTSQYKEKPVADYTEGLGENHQIQIYSVSKKETVIFKAFLSGFNDSLKLNWKIQEVGLNRLDPIVNYINSERVINIKFSVPSAELAEAMENFKRLNQLKTFLYPNKKTISSNSANFVAPPLIKILFKNWIKGDLSNSNYSSAKEDGLLGYIDSIDFNPNVIRDNYFFNENDIIPSSFEISFNFFVLNSQPQERFLEQTRVTGSIGSVIELPAPPPTPEGSEVVTVRPKTEAEQITFLNPAYNIRCSFKPFLTSFSDKITSNWNKIDVFGKTDKLSTYKNTTRKINIKFSAPSETEMEAKKNFSNLNNLFYSLYPQYDNNYKIKNVPYIYLKFKNWISQDNGGTINLFGVINQLDFVPSFDSSFFTDGGKLFPMNFEVSIDFTVLHTTMQGNIIR